jgi:hypothetical protein
VIELSDIEGALERVELRLGITLDATFTELRREMSGRFDAIDVRRGRLEALSHTIVVGLRGLEERARISEARLAEETEG